MGQKVNPIIYRLGSNKHWRSSVYMDKPYSSSLITDLKIRAYLDNLLTSLHIHYDNVLIKKYPHINVLYISLTIVNGTINLAEVINHLKTLTGYKEVKIDITIGQHYKTIPVYNAHLLSKYVVRLIETRSRIGLKKLLFILKEMKELKGYKIRIGGRINGVEMARHNTYKKGSLPLQSMRSAIDYAYHTANTKYGIIGVKVWLLY